MTTKEIKKELIAAQKEYNQHVENCTECNRRLENEYDFHDCDDEIWMRQRVSSLEMDLDNAESIFKQELEDRNSFLLKLPRIILKED